MTAENRPPPASAAGVILIWVNPAARSWSRYCAAVTVPDAQPVRRSASARTAGSASSAAMTSLTPSRPPGRSTRNASASTRGLSADRLTTQLEITASTCASGSGMSSMLPCRNSTFPAPAAAAFARARLIISGEASSP